MMKVIEGVSIFNSTRENLFIIYGNFCSGLMKERSGKGSSKIK
jgi:hypothetical protein